MGQGKTTFFKLALRFYDPQQGAVLLGGRPVGDYAADNLYEHIAMMSQFPAFFYDTLRANMQMAKADATDEEIRAICEKTGVWKILQAGVDGNPLDKDFAAAQRLSGGQKKLLALTRCLLRDPAILFLDEPTGALDPQARRNLWDTLRAISAEGRTVVLTTHHMDEAELLCERVAIMDHGKILLTGPPAALIRELDYPSRITVSSGRVSADEARGALPETEVTDDGVTLAITARDPGPALAWLSGRGALAGLAVRGGTLEDVFLKLTGREYRA